MVPTPQNQPAEHEDLSSSLQSQGHDTHLGSNSHSHSPHIHSHSPHVHSLNPPHSRSPHTLPHSHSPHALPRSRSPHSPPHLHSPHPRPHSCSKGSQPCSSSLLHSQPPSPQVQSPRAQFPCSLPPSPSPHGSYTHTPEAEQQRNWTPTETYSSAHTLEAEQCYSRPHRHSQSYGQSGSHGHSKSPCHPCSQEHSQLRGSGTPWSGSPTQAPPHSQPPHLSLQHQHTGGETVQLCFTLTISLRPLTGSHSASSPAQQSLSQGVSRPNKRTQSSDSDLEESLTPMKIHRKDSESNG